MFNKDGFEKIGEDIYVYHNFVTKEECDEIVNIANNTPDERWFGNPDPKDHQFTGANNDTIPSIQKRIKDIVDDGIDLNYNDGIVRMIKGAFWGLHADNHDFLEVRKASESLKDGQDYVLAQNNLMGIILYFNDFEGGSLVYPEQGIEYHPKPGDLVMHSAEDHCKHLVTELLSDVRYSHSNNLFNYIKVPKV
jgi:hypothetical protein